MNDEIEKTNQFKQPMQPFHVFLGDGRTVAIEAAGFDHVVNAEERIVFVDADGAEIKDIFCRAEPVALVVPDSRIAKTHVFMDLQTKVADLTKRLDKIEQSQGSPASE